MTRWRLRLADGLALVTRPLAWLAGAVVALLVLVILGIVGAQFVDRYIADTGLHAPEQLARIAVVWLTFLGFALAMRDRATIRIDLIDRQLPPVARIWLACVFDLAILALSLLLLFHAWRVVEVGAMQELLGTPFSAALPNAGLFTGLLLVVLFKVEALLRGAEPAGAEDIMPEAGG